MGKTAAFLLLLTASVIAAPPVPGSPAADVPEGVSDGVPIVTESGVPLTLDADTTIDVCVIKVEFLPDYTETTSGNGEFESSAFEVSVLMQQVEDYFTDVSGGVLELNLSQYPEEDGAFLLDHQMAYYGADDKNYLGQCQLMRDAIEAADPDVDFSRYGAVIILHAGAGNEADILGDSPDDIHSMFIGSGDLEYYLGITGVSTDDGVIIREASIDPEREAQDNYGLSPLGTIVHEFGHQLGLPDLYNTLDGTVGVGGWDLMGYGQWLMNGYWPSAPGAWCRMALGWETPQVIAPGQYTAQERGTIYRIPLTATEYLLVENRQRDPDGNGQCGPHERDFGLPGSGILIWHVDQTRLGDYRTANLVNVDPLHKGVDVEEADGIQDLDYGFPTWYSIEGSEYDPWKRDGYGWEFTPESTPSTDASWGGYTGVSIEVLSNSGNAMDFIYSHEGTVPGWPYELSGGRFGPLLWNPPSGEYIVAVQGNGQAIAVDPQGENAMPMGNNVTAPPVVCEIGGVEYLLLCEEDGEAHMRLPDWTEAPGWPVDIGAEAVQAICSQPQSSVYIIAENSLSRFELDGMEAPGSPTSFTIPLLGGCVFPHEGSPGLVLASSDGSLRRTGPAGGTVFGWPVHPGSEDITLPVAADIDRDGEIEVAAVSGGKLWIYDGDSNLEQGLPAMLEGEALSDPFLADLEGDGYLEVLVETTVGLEAFTFSGTCVSDWPWETETDSLVYDYRRFTGGIGGSGFVLAPLRDGRVVLWNDGDTWAFGDGILGAPVLHRFQGEEVHRVTAMAASGSMGAFYTDFSPQGWHTGLDRCGERCWYGDDLPQLQGSGELLDVETFFVWPNPVTDDLGYVRFLPGSDSTYEIRIFNVAGELVDLFSGNAQGGAPWEVPWSTKDLAPGVYYVCLELTSGGVSAEALFQAAVIN